MSRISVAPWKIILVLLVTLFSLAAAAPTFNGAFLFSWLAGSQRAAYEDASLSYGLDLAGGLDVTFRVDCQEERVESNAATTLQILRHRLNGLGVENVSVRRQGSDQIRVQVPAMSESKQRFIKEKLSASDMLGFHRLIQVSESPFFTRAEKESIVLRHTSPAKGASAAKSSLYYELEKQPLLGGDSVKRARISFDEMMGMPRVQFDLTDDGAKEFGQITSQFVGKHLAIVMGGEVYSAPIIEGPILNGQAVIRGDFQLEECRQLANAITAGALPAPLIKVAECSVGPTLGKASLDYGRQAAVVGFSLVAAFMACWYGTPGVIAAGALCLNAAMLVSSLVACRAALTLPGIAGVVLTAGMAVDANVIIFERIKEELALGKTTRAAIAAGFDKAFTAILDANVTTIIVAAVLFFLDLGPARGFALTLALGISCSMFSALFVVRTAMELLYGGGRSLPWAQALCPSAQAL